MNGWSAYLSNINYADHLVAALMVQNSLKPTSEDVLRLKKMSLAEIQEFARGGPMTFSKGKEDFIRFLPRVFQVLFPRNFIICTFLY
jgi:hypothetical protein